VTKHDNGRACMGRQRLQDIRYHRQVNYHPTDIRQETPGELTVLWDDGHESRYPFPFLRFSCPCASCNELRRQQVAVTVTPEGGTPTQLVGVGNYAVQFTWQDGHDSGIYAWDFLRELCRCAECVSAGH